MAHKFMDLTFTDAVKGAQKHYYGRSQRVPPAGERDQLGPAEMEFVHERDSFYMGSVNDAGWPYIQHRGGAAGFLRVLDPHTLGFADYKGNRQLLSTGNLSGDDRVTLFLMDYPNRSRLKLLGHARVLDARAHGAELERLAEVDERALVERLFLIDVVAFDWNCPKYITPRYSAAEVQELVHPLHERIAELEAHLKKRQAP